jgi:hypothetical protein
MQLTDGFKNTVGNTVLSKVENLLTSVGEPAEHIAARFPLDYLVFTNLGKVA